MNIIADRRLGNVATAVCSHGPMPCPSCEKDCTQRYGLMGSGEQLVCDLCFNADNPEYEPDLFKRFALLFSPDLRLADGYDARRPLTVYVCACSRSFEFLTLAVLCAETHPVASELTGGCAAAPVTVRRAS